MFRKGQVPHFKNLNCEVKQRQNKCRQWLKVAGGYCRSWEPSPAYRFPLESRGKEPEETRQMLTVRQWE